MKLLKPSTKLGTYSRGKRASFAENMTSPIIVMNAGEDI
jgi:hypothetical protein